MVRKTLARKSNPTTRGSLKPQWNIIPDGTITNYSPHTITLDTDNRKNTVIRNNDLAIVTQTVPSPPKQPNEKPRLVHMVACKTVNEYHSNQRKLKPFYLEEPAARTALSSACRQNPINTEPLGHEAIVNMARANQRKQARPTKTKIPKGKAKKQEQKKTTTKADQQQQRRATTFAQKSKEAALKDSQSLRNDKRKLLYSSSSENKSLIKLSPHQLPTLKKFNIRETPGAPHSR